MGSLLVGIISIQGALFAIDTSNPSKMNVVGGGIIGALESYYTYKEAEKDGRKVVIHVYDKGQSFDLSADGNSSTNTSYNIVPSLTIDEILSVVPRGKELVDKLALKFNQPGGIRVDDVEDVNDSESAHKFVESVSIYGNDPNHDDRTLALLTLGKKSMDLWQQMYDEGDDELKAILLASNFNPCREPTAIEKVLHDGYRIDLIYGIENAKNRALNMKADYEKLGYQNCTLLSPDEVVKIDPYLEDFCIEHSSLDENHTRVWNSDAVALWRPGGCIDTRTFLPKFYAYLKKNMGQDFDLQFNNEVTQVEFEDDRIVGLKFSNGAEIHEEADYIFCPGESVGTLQKLGFEEPAYAAFAGPSLLISIPLSQDQIEEYRSFSHCMEVHNEGIVLAWQARFKNDSIFIGVAGTKAFYGDKQPKIDEDFALNRNLVQLNIVNNVLPEFISLAYGSCTCGKTLSSDDLTSLVEKGIARRWVGRRAVAYDGFPTLGALYHKNQRVPNARCTTHLGSGGVSFGPGSIYVSRNADNIQDPFIHKIATYADSRRQAK